MTELNRMEAEISRFYCARSEEDSGISYRTEMGTPWPTTKTNSGYSMAHNKSDPEIMFFVNDGYQIEQTSCHTH